MTEDAELLYFRGSLEAIARITRKPLKEIIDLGREFLAFYGTVYPGFMMTLVQRDDYALDGLWCCVSLWMQRGMLG